MLTKFRLLKYISYFKNINFVHKIEEYTPCTIFEIQQSLDWDLINQCFREKKHNYWPVTIAKKSAAFQKEEKISQQHFISVLWWVSDFGVLWITSALGSSNLPNFMYVILDLLFSALCVICHLFMLYVTGFVLSVSSSSRGDFTTRVVLFAYSKLEVTLGSTKRVTTVHNNVRERML